MVHSWRDEREKKTLNIIKLNEKKILKKYEESSRNKWISCEKVRLYLMS